MSRAAEPQLLAAMAAAEAGASVADPLGLPFARRFDVLAKWLYARRRLGSLPAWAHVDVVGLYRRHIHLRTGGREPGEEHLKSSLADYERAFDDLVDDMAAHGYDTRHPVRISRVNHLPRNGAHRLATALATGCDVAWRWDDGPGGVWGGDWFADHGFTDEEQNQLLRAWAELVPERVCVAVLWSPARAAWPQLEAGLVGAGHAVLAARTLTLPRPALDELVRDVYAVDGGPCPGRAIEAKVGLLREFEPSLRVLFLQAPAGGADARPRLKTTLREAARAVVPVEWYATLHLSATTAEARHLLDIFASANNLRRLVQRGPLRPGLVDLLVELHEQTGRRGIAPRDCCIVGGAALDALGLRAADDVDFTLQPAVRARHFDRGIHALAPRVDVVTADYARSFDPARPAPDDAKLLADPSLHFVVRGFRVADPRVVLTRKQHQARPKDKRDLPLLAGFLGRP